MPGDIVIHRNKKTLLITGGAHSDIPMIEAGKALGFHVVSTGNRAEDLGHRHADEYIPADFSDLDQMLALAKDLRIDAICACCNDFGALSAAYVAEQLGLPGHDGFATTQLLHHKDKYREFAQKNGIASPLAQGFDSERSARESLEGYRYPVIVKPVDLTGGKGIARADNAAAAAEAIKVAFATSRAKRVVVEEFIEGTRHGISTFICGGKVAFAFDDDEYYHLSPYLVSAASSHGSTPRKAIARLIATIEKIAGLLALKDGIVHVQFIVGRDGEPVIIEICRRPPGDLYVRLVQHATGVDYPAYIVRAAAGLDIGDLRPTDAQRCIARHCVMCSHAGTVRDVEFDASIKDRIIDRMMWWKPGDIIQDAHTQKLGIVFVQFETAEDLRLQTARMQTLIRPRLQE